MKRITSFIKNEAVLVISFLLALVSFMFVTPSVKTLHHIDFRTLALLLCLMIVVEGFNRLGVFQLFAEKLLARISTVRGLGATLCLLCFFSAMLITNDVALITFVPFTVITLNLTGRQKDLCSIVVLETVAANLGSMLTPIGNPQNLYLFSAYRMSFSAFFCAVLPFALLSLILTVAACMFFSRDKLALSKSSAPKKTDKMRCAVYAFLFALALLTVFRVLPYPATLLICMACAFFFDRGILKNVDYLLLLTFVCLFIFIGNLSEIPAVSTFLQEMILGKEVLMSVLLSQIFSNVPAAILLSGFTNNGTALLIGTNLGGLGTLIASMASLISFKLIAKENVGTRKYFLLFTVLNAIFLISNLLLWFMIK